MNNIIHRTNIRDYTNELVEEEKIELLLRAGMAAPSAINQQSWHFVVVTKKEILNQLATSSPYASSMSRCPLGIVVCFNKNCKVPKYAMIDCSAATENILLEADYLGLGAVWLGIALIQERMDLVRDIIHLDDTLEVFALISIGYHKEEKTQIDRYDTTKITYIR